MPEDMHLWDAIRQYIVAAARERAAFLDALDATASGEDDERARARTEATAAKANCDRAARRVRDIDNRQSNVGTPSPYVRELGLIAQAQRDADAISYARPTQWADDGGLRLVEKSGNPDGTIAARGPNWPEDA